MEVAIIENNVITAIGDYRLVFPNTSFNSNGPDNEFLTQHNAKRVNLWKPYDALTSHLVYSPPYIEGEWVYRVIVQDRTPGEIESVKDTAKQQLRTARNTLLVQSDWTQVADSPVDKTAWAEYRKALRDFPATVEDARLPYNFPHDPAWIEQP